MTTHDNAILHTLDAGGNSSDMAVQVVSIIGHLRVIVMDDDRSETEIERRIANNNNNNNYNITSMTLKSSGARARKRNKTNSLIKFKSRGHNYRGHHQYEGPPTI